MPVMIVHVSNREAMEEIRWAQAKGLRVSGETCTQYLVLTEGSRGSQHGGREICLLAAAARHGEPGSVLGGAAQGVFSVFSSDHCPFRYDDPRGQASAARASTSFRWVPNGIPGIGTRLPILFSEGVVKGRIDLNRFVALTATNHAKTYGLYPRKGTIAVGADADIAIWDPDA